MEEEGFTTLVVCDTGYFGGYVGSYVLEEEEGEVDGFVDNAKNMVKYVVRYVSNHMEGEFIVFSKWIPSWMLLIGGKVKNSRGVWKYV